MKAAITIDDAYSSKVKDVGSSANRLPKLITPKGQRTPLAIEIENDEIHWWVFKKEKETDIPELRERTARALDAAQALKDTAADLWRNSPSSYDTLLESLTKFVAERRNEIEILHDYVQWLHARHPLAPAILYSYRVWGSTRRSDRWIAGQADTIDTEARQAIEAHAEMALGLLSRGLYAFDRARMEIGWEIAERMASNEESGPIEVSLDDALERAARTVYDEAAEYFEQIRDSLRQIQIDIDKATSQRALWRNDEFWRQFILTAASSKGIEPRLWDFKETLPLWHTSGAVRDREKFDFAENVASFANVDGGVLIVGVTDNYPRQIVGIGNTPHEVETRVKVLSDVLALHLKYEREIAQLRPIVVPDGTGADRICLAVVIAQASQAVAAMDNEKRSTWPVRRETGITRETSPTFAGNKHVKSDNHDFMQALEQFVRS